MNFETFVRPFVFRPFRPPAPALPVLPEDKPDQGVVVLRGLSELIDLTYSETSSWSKSKNQEKQRTVDRQRIYQKQEDGTINKENFVDVDTMKKVEMMDNGTGEPSIWVYAEPRQSDNVYTLQPDVVYVQPDVQFRDIKPGEPYRSSPQRTKQNAKKS